MIPEPPEDAIVAYKNNKLYDYSKAKAQFYDVHHQLHRQRGHFTKEQYDELLENAPEASEEETRMISLGGRIRSDADGDSSAVPKLNLSKMKKKTSVFDREEEDDGR